MNKDNAHLYLPLIQALVDGKTIQFNLAGGEISDRWEDVVEVNAFNKKPEYYRIKPEPIERWINIFPDGSGHSVYKTKKEAIDNINDSYKINTKTIKLMEEM